jgi:hypothetical protein
MFLLFAKTGAEAQSIEKTGSNSVLISFRIVGATRGSDDATTVNLETKTADTSCGLRVAILSKTHWKLNPLSRKEHPSYRDGANLERQGPLTDGLDQEIGKMFSLSPNIRIIKNNYFDASSDTLFEGSENGQWRVTFFDPAVNGPPYWKMDIKFDFDRKWAFMTVWFFRD